MKYLFIVSSFVIFLAACTNETKNAAPDLVLKFGKTHFEPLTEEGSKKTLFVILNPSECGSCEAQVTSFVNSIYPNFKSVTVVPNDVKISSEIKKSKTISMKRQKLDQYGLLNANGSILIYEGKNCVYFSPIDVVNTNKMKDTITSFVN